MNRNLAVKHDRSLRQKREAGRIEGTKRAYLPRSKYHTKPALRELAASAQHMVRPFEHQTTKASVPPDFDVVMVPYMPHRAPRKWTAAQLAYVNCGDELVKRNPAR